MREYKYVCIKEVLIDDKGFLEKYRLYFKVHKIYEFNKDSHHGVEYIFIHNSLYFLSQKEMEEFFMPLSECREQQINKILDE